MQIDVTSALLTREDKAGTVFEYRNQLYTVLGPVEDSERTLRVLRLGSDGMERKFSVPDPEARLVRRLTAEV